MEINKWYEQALNMADVTNNVKVLNKIHILFSSFKNNKIPQTKHHLPEGRSARDKG